MNFLRLQGITLLLAGRPLFTRLDLTVVPSEVLTVMGPSGAGKSSLIAYIGGHLDSCFSTEGRVFIGERDVSHLPAEKRQIGILFQDDLLFPHLSVGDNLAFGLRGSIHGSKARGERIEAALERADLSGFAERDPATLSGGQRARVALMRTLLAEPKALLLDEPFSKLDGGLRGEIRAFVFEHARIERLPVLLVTHDYADAEAAGGRVLHL
jgi:putative thiamine transport system ATP-binding protein